MNHQLIIRGEIFFPNFDQWLLTLRVFHLRSNAKNEFNDFIALLDRLLNHG